MCRVAQLVEELHQAVCILVFVVSGKLLLQLLELDRPQAREVAGEGIQIILTVLVNKDNQLDGRVSDLLRRMAKKIMGCFVNQFQVCVLDSNIVFCDCCIHNSKAKIKSSSILAFKPLEELRHNVLLCAIPHQHLLQDPLCDILKIWFVVLNLVQKIGMACKSYRFDVFTEFDVRVQAVKALILSCQVAVFNHLFQDWPIHIEWVLWVSIHLIFFLKLLLSIVPVKQLLVDKFECIHPDFPFRMKDLIFEAEILYLLLIGGIKAWFSSLSR